MLESVQESLDREVNDSLGGRRIRHPRRVFLFDLPDARAGHYAIVAVCRTLAAAAGEYILRRRPGNGFVCVDLLLVLRTAVH